MCAPDDDIREGLAAFSPRRPPPRASLVFDGIEFGNLDMVQLVTFPKTREMLLLSAEFLEIGDISDALGHAAVAFAYLLREYRDRSDWAGFAGWASVSTPSVRDDDVGDAIEYLAGEVEEGIQRLEEAIDLVALGIDLRRWQKFRLWVPEVSRFAEEPKYREYGKTARLQLDAEHVDYCRRFVVDAALRLQALSP
jgi:hypothetical protein